MFRSLNKITRKVNRATKMLEDKDVFTIIIIILVAFGSFGLGRVSSIDRTKTPILVENKASVASKLTNDTAVIANSGIYVASRNGTKYHYPWCSGAQRIKDENKLWFDSVEDAKNAGYTPAANCKGL